MTGPSFQFTATRQFARCAHLHMQLQPAWYGRMNAIVQHSSWATTDKAMAWLLNRLLQVHPVRYGVHRPQTNAISSRDQSLLSQMLINSQLEHPRAWWHAVAPSLSASYKMPLVSLAGCLPAKRHMLNSLPRNTCCQVAFCAFRACSCCCSFLRRSLATAGSACACFGCGGPSRPSSSASSSSAPAS